MNNNKISFFVFLALVFDILVFFVGYKVGDSRGFEAGLKVGYTYDCQEEIRTLRATHEDLKKAVDFSRDKASEVQRENIRLQIRQNMMQKNPNLVQDSIRNASAVKAKNDSIDDLFRKGKMKGVRPQVDPYTGQVNTLMRDAFEHAGK